MIDPDPLLVEDGDCEDAPLRVAIEGVAELDGVTDVLLHPVLDLQAVPVGLRVVECVEDIDTEVL